MGKKKRRGRGVGGWKGRAGLDRRFILVLTLLVLFKIFFDFLIAKFLLHTCNDYE